MSNTILRRGRGRPPKTARAPEGTRAMLVRAGVGLLTEKGFSSTCVDDVLNATGISKGRSITASAARKSSVRR
ncbi:hypothetical protein RAA17_16920 [Komagataeibacter rhaeticus]|nr:hypothetical protein [Komagataeibacter rhaeticus]